MRIVPALVLVSSTVLAACYAASEPPPDQAANADGRVLAGALGCAGCHGADFSGGVGPNLTPDIETGLGGWTDDEITRAIRSGVDDQGSALCPSMPRFSALDDEQASSLVAFFRALPPVSNQVPSAECVAPDLPSDAGLDDAGVVIVDDDASSEDGGCAGYAGPTTPAACHACTTAPCQANGCFNGYYCDLSQTRCVPRPSGC